MFACNRVCARSLVCLRRRTGSVFPVRGQHKCVPRVLWSVVTPLSVICVGREIPGLARNNFHAPAPPSTKRSAYPTYSWGKNISVMLCHSQNVLFLIFVGKLQILLTFWVNIANKIICFYGLFAPFVARQTKQFDRRDSRGQRVF